MTDVGAVQRPRAVLVDHDCLLADDAAQAVARLQCAQVAVAVLCDGAADPRVVAAVGPTGAAVCCPHEIDDGCLCRRPAPGLLLQAAAVLGVVADDCLVLGSAPRDAEAAAAIGARTIVLRPNASLLAAVDDLLTVADEPAVGEAVPAPPAPAAVVDADMPIPDVIPLVLAGARRLPPVSPWSAGVVG